MIREAKEINKERKVIDEKLTNAEIEYNKVYYIQKELKLKIKNLEKKINEASEEGICNTAWSIWFFFWSTP